MKVWKRTGNSKNLFTNDFFFEAIDPLWIVLSYCVFFFVRLWLKCELSYCYNLSMGNYILCVEAFICLCSFSFFPLNRHIRRDVFLVVNSPHRFVWKFAANVADERRYVPTSSIPILLFILSKKKSVTDLGKKFIEIIPKIEIFWMV